MKAQSWLLVLLVALGPMVAKGQFLYGTVNGGVTISGYSGAGGTVIIPATIGGLPVTAIGNWAFFNNSNVAMVAITDGVRSIGMEAFRHCSGLVMVSIGQGITNIGNLAFDSCNNLTNVTMGDNVIGLGENAFSGCSSLTSVRIPNSVTVIPDQAFESCSNLTSLTIGSSVTNLGNNAFLNCSSLASIYFRGNVPAYKACVFCGDSVTVYYLSGESGWGSTFAGRPTKLWNPQAQTADGSFGLLENRFGFNISGTSDVPLVVEASSNVAAQSWVPLRTGALTNGSVYFSDSQWTNFPVRFYRIRSP